MTPKSIFEYDNYREFLRDTYLLRRSQDKKFSFRFFARTAGFNSCGFLKMVMDGHRNITSESISKVARALKLNKEESEFFKNLVFLNQAKEPKEKEIYVQEIIRSKSYRKICALKVSQYHYFMHWYYVAIREMVGLPGFKEDHNWIARQLGADVTPLEVKRSLDELFLLGLIRREEDGTLRQTDANLSTPDEVIVGSVAQYHREMMSRASVSIDKVPREKREISGSTISVSEETAKKIKELTQSFRNSIFELASRETHPETVYQLGIQFFPLLSSTEEK
jgi:uncharacterized protein (TIGR02147 family)